MDSMVEHLRVHVFDNGKYLRSRNLTSPNGGQIVQSLLQIRQVRQNHKLRSTTIKEELFFYMSEAHMYLLNWLLGSSKCIMLIGADIFNCGLLH